VSLTMFPGDSIPTSRADDSKDRKPLGRLQVKARILTFDSGKRQTHSPSSQEISYPGSISYSLEPCFPQSPLLGFVLLSTVLFSIFCYTLELQRLGRALVERKDRS
jgi:hypothetical protein